MQRLFPLIEDCLQALGVRRSPTTNRKRLGGWNEHDIIPYRHPGSDSYDGSIFAWEMTAGKDGEILLRPVVVINPPEEEWREYPY